MVLQRDGIDDKGMELISLVNVTAASMEAPPALLNAFWWTTQDVVRPDHARAAGWSACPATWTSLATNSPTESSSPRRTWFTRPSPAR